MKIVEWRPLFIGIASLALVALLIVPSQGFAQELVRHAFSGGATDAAGGGLRLRGTLGEAGFVGATSGPGYTLGIGFWARAYFSIATDAPTLPPVLIPLVNELSQSFPNPFRSTATISFGVERAAPVRLRIFDVTGRRVATLVDAELAAGRYDRQWTGFDQSGTRVSSGVYFYTLDIGSWSRTKRMLKLR